ncbi:DNA N-6-adenine-methyltransferase [Vibrio phage 13VT501A]|nr:DNA N-6-adenine-methyltransferase [Vibrio phage 13VT501A]
MNTENKSNTPKEIKDLWQTPKFVFDYYDRRFGFTCDFAASHKNALCEHYFSEPVNGEGGALGASKDDVCFDGSGAVWCNPPYSDIMPWVKECYRLSHETGKVFVMLIPADTSVKWFKLAFENCTECHFISGRLSFINAETRKPVSGNNKGSVVFIFDPKSPVKQSVHLIDRDSMK